MHSKTEAEADDRCTITQASFELMQLLAKNPGIVHTVLPPGLPFRLEPITKTDQLLNN